MFYIYFELLNFFAADLSLTHLTNTPLDLKHLEGEKGMREKMIKMATIAALLVVHLHSNAEDITDTVTDVEEITADSEAHKAQARAAREELAREQVENAKALKEAKKVKADAEAKRVQAAQTIQSSEAELAKLASEQQKMRTEIDKLQFNIMAAERIIQKSKDKIDKKKGENAALAEIKKEKMDKLAALEKEQMQFLRDASAAEDEHALLKRDLEKVSADEIAATKNFEKIKADAAIKKTTLEKGIADLKERYRQLREQRHRAHSEAYKAKQFNNRLEQTMKAGQGEVEASDAQPAAAPAAAPEPKQAEPQARN